YACQERLHREYRLSTWPRYDLSQVTGKLVFSEEGVPRVSANFQFVGSLSNRSTTWLWAWANESMDPELRQSIEKVRAYGEAENLPLLTTPRLPANESDGWEMTAVAANLLQAQGAYRGGNGHLLTFVVLTALEWVS